MAISAVLPPLFHLPSSQLTPLFAMLYATGQAAWLDELERFSYADLLLFRTADFTEDRPSIWSLSERD